MNLVASSRFHRLLRRGRSYGPALAPKDAIKPQAPVAERGIQFICLVGNISRQFEFVQNAWTMNSKFDGVQNEKDPMLGIREPLMSGESTDHFQILPIHRGRCGQPVICRSLLPPLVADTFLCPGCAHISIHFPLYLLTDWYSIMTKIKNRILKAIHNFLILLLRIERRLEPWFRAQWDYLFRRTQREVYSYLINRWRKNEGLQLAEENSIRMKKKV